jgi:hypothetical protein
LGRPKKNIDEEQVRQLAAIDCSLEEMALILKCDERTLQRRFAGVIKEGRASGIMSLKRQLFKKVQEGNTAVIIFLSKVKLGYREVQYIDQKTEHSIQATQQPVTKEKLIEAIKADPALNPEEIAHELNPASIRDDRETESRVEANTGGGDEDSPSN